jgi:alpha-1,3-glucosyltransferase
MYLIKSMILFKKQFSCFSLYFYEQFYIGFLPVIIIYETVLHKIIFSDKLPFLPLALTSIYCTLGITYSYTIYYYEYLFRNNYCIKDVNKKESEQK